MDKLRSTLKLFVRDWSQDVGVLLFPRHHVATCLQGKPERDACYEPMKEALMTYFEGKNRCVSISSYILFAHIYRETVRVLVPGAGLGRLAYDVAKLGGSLSYVPIHVHVTHT